MASATTERFDVADHLNSPDEAIAYLDAVLEEGDDRLLLLALRDVVKSKGFASVAKRSGLRRETLYQALSEDGNPRLSTLHSVLGGINGQSVGRRFTAAARQAGISRRLTAHSGRVGLVSELTAWGASTTEVMLAGAWKTARMVSHYSAGARAERGAVAKYF